jgi:hypothetical protein
VLFRFFFQFSLPRPTSRIPIPESDDSESDESSDGANEEEDPAADAIVEAFEIAMPALLRALCQDENVTNPVIQSRALATLFYFAELKCEKLAEHIRENAPLQHRLNLIIASMVHLVTRTTSEFEFDEDIVLYVGGTKKPYCSSVNSRYCFCFPFHC